MAEEMKVEATPVAEETKAPEVAPKEQHAGDRPHGQRPHGDRPHGKGDRRHKTTLGRRDQRNSLFSRMQRGRRGARVVRVFHCAQICA